MLMAHPLLMTHLLLLPAQDSFLISASDGLWGLVGDQEAVDAVAVVLAEVRAAGQKGGDAWHSANPTRENNNVPCASGWGPQTLGGRPSQGVE